MVRKGGEGEGKKRKKKLSLRGHRCPPHGHHPSKIEQSQTLDLICNLNAGLYRFHPY